MVHSLITPSPASRHPPASTRGNWPFSWIPPSLWSSCSILHCICVSFLNASALKLFLCLARGYHIIFENVRPCSLYIMFLRLILDLLVGSGYWVHWIFSISYYAGANDALRHLARRGTAGLWDKGTSSSGVLLRNNTSKAAGTSLPAGFKMTSLAIFHTVHVRFPYSDLELLWACFIFCAFISPTGT